MHLQKAKADSDSNYRKMLEKQELKEQMVEMADTQYEALKAMGKMKKAGK